MDRILASRIWRDGVISSPPFTSAGSSERTLSSSKLLRMTRVMRNTLLVQPCESWWGEMLRVRSLVRGESYISPTALAVSQPRNNLHATWG
jgi:hypothetical protein